MRIKFLSPNPIRWDGQNLPPGAVVDCADEKRTKALIALGVAAPATAASTAASAQAAPAPAVTDKPAGPPEVPAALDYVPAEAFDGRVVELAPTDASRAAIDARAKRYLALDAGSTTTLRKASLVVCQQDDLDAEVAALVKKLKPQWALVRMPQLDGYKLKGVYGNLFLHERANEA